jgi:hypothetical protein
MTVVTFSFAVAKGGQAVQMHPETSCVNGLLGTSFKALHGFTSPHVCRSRDLFRAKKYIWSKMIRFDCVRTMNLRLNFVDLHALRLSFPPSSLQLLSFLDLTNMDVSSEELNRLCPRFRVLIIGRRNAGKTTILEKMTGSDEGAEPIIHDKEGRRVVSPSHISPISIVKMMIIE